MIMSDERENDVNNYIIARTPDKAELARLLRKAKGVDKNMNQFAEECETSGSTFSRIANCKITQAVAPELLVKIAEHADPDSGVQAYMLFRANGMLPKDVAERREQMPNRYIREDEIFSREIGIKNALVNDLISRGNQIQLLREIDDPSAGRFIRSTGRTNMLLRVSGCEAEYWKFRVMGMRFSRVASENETRRPSYKGEARLLLSRLAEVFLEDMWEPEGFKMCKLSFIFEDEEFYRAFNELVENRLFNNWFSNILIDIEKGQVIEEFVYNRQDGQKLKSPLDYPRMDDGDGGDDDLFDGSIFGEDE